ncbi:MAG: DNRLRE domain-containing protein, partial [Coriobacteriia bacterium]|nr:DNRLRE domain-containing protein [Coriobacteriia bacterium]
MRGVIGGFFGRAVGCALSLCLVTGPVFAQATPAYATEPVTAETSTPSTPAVSQEASISAEASPTVVREEITRRTENSKHYLLSDGSYRADVYEEPIHRIDESGVFVDIVPDLILGEEPGERVTASADIEVLARAQTPQEAPLEVSGQGWSAGIDMRGVAERSRVVIGPQVRYLDVAPSTDLLYEATGEGVKETVLLKSSDAPQRFEFDLSLSGVEMRKSPVGGYGLYRENGERVAALGGLYVFDSGVDGAGNAAVCEEATMTVESTPGGAHVVYEVSRAWLDDPSRVFPVHVDPTLSTGDWLDTYVTDKNATAGYPYDTDLRCGYYDSTTGTNRSLLNFSIASIPAGTYVRSAQLSAYQYHQYYTNTATRTYLAKVTSAWSASTGWSARPSYAYYASQLVTGRNVWVDWDVRSIVQGWVDGAVNHGFQFYQVE